jgi:hypothetical protein
LFFVVARNDGGMRIKKGDFWLAFEGKSANYLHTFLPVSVKVHQDYDMF